MKRRHMCVDSVENEGEGQASQGSFGHERGGVGRKFDENSVKVARSYYREIGLMQSMPTHCI